MVQSTVKFLGRYGKYAVIVMLDSVVEYEVSCCQPNTIGVDGILFSLFTVVKHYVFL